MSLLPRWRPLAAAFLLLSPLMVGALPHPAQAEPHVFQDDDGLDWTHGYTMVFLEEGADVQNARRWIQSRGGRIAVMLPPRVLAGWIPPEMDAALVGHAGIRSVHRDAGPSEHEISDKATLAAARYFDRVVQGRLPAPQIVKPNQEPQRPPGSDAFHGDPVSQFEVMENLRNTQQHNLWKLGSAEELTANSESMVGTVTVTLFFVESDGSGSDPDQFDWSAAAEQDVFDEAVAGLSWWSDQADEHADCWVTFLVQAHFATEDSRLEQAREPVLHDSATYAAIVSDVLKNFGYNSGSHLARATAYNTAQRIANDTDWAYSAFVAANPTGATSFTDGFAAWAFLGGPYTALLQRSFTWQFRRVFAHESGHIFGACDEYYVEGYGGCNGCNECWTTGVDNGNCEQCNANSVGCMMKENTWNLCGYTPGQLGWWRSPCIAGPLPAPIVDVMTPNSMWHAQTGFIDVEGDHFNLGTSVDLGPGVVVREVEYVSATLLRLDLEVEAESQPGMRDLVVVGPDGGTTTLSDAFEIRPTRVHYVSGTGNGSFPFASAATAATDIASALAVASNGDTLRLTAGTWPGFDLDQALVIEGGWDDGFLVRTPETSPTILLGSGSIMRISGADVAPVLDGLVIRAGKGNAISLPEWGVFDSGGGVLCTDASPAFRNCIFEDNKVGSSLQDGIGGAVFLYRSTATFEGCIFRNNKAGSGGALGAFESSVELRDNLFQQNTLETLWGSGRGAAIHLYKSTLTLNEDVFDSNTSAAQGGAITATDLSQIQATAVQFQANMVTGNGGALWTTDSDVDLTACIFDNNSAGNSGGALHVSAGSLTASSSLFIHNQSSNTGGAIYSEQNAPKLRNLTIVGNAGSSASGLYLASLQPGAFLQNSVLAFNEVGGMISASATPPALDWNVFWQNGGPDALGVGLGAHDWTVDPLMVDVAGGALHPGAHSPLVDSGDPAVLDVDGSRCDRGAYGGPAARSLAPERITGMASSATRVGTKLTWDAAGSASIKRYLIYRGSSSQFQPDVANFIAEVKVPASSWELIQPPSGTWYKVNAIDAEGRAGGYSVAVEQLPPSESPPRNRHRLVLEPIYPNPTNPSATIEFVLPQAMPVEVLVYDTRGRRVRQLATGVHPAGSHRLSWDGRADDGQASASGVYWIRMLTAQQAFTRKLILVR